MKQDRTDASIPVPANGGATILPQRAYPAKILLIGEHAVLDGGQALAMAWPARKAHWVWAGSSSAGQAISAASLPAREEDREIPESRRAALHRFAEWLISGQNFWNEWLDMESLARSLNSRENMPWLDSDIPQGYGLGSSGSVCAAIYDAFGRRELPLTLDEGLAMFARMEAYFHGSSSGVDPLISYLGARGAASAIHFGGGKPMEAAIIPQVARAVGRQNPGQETDSGEIFSLFSSLSGWPLNSGGLESHQGSTAEVNSAMIPVLRPACSGSGSWTLSLYDTGIARQTAPFVEEFTRRLENPVFRTSVREKLIPANAAAIGALLGGTETELGGALLQISSFTLEYLDFMIPEAFRVGWGELLAAARRTKSGQPRCLVKLCGAGGGGYLQIWERE